MSELIIFKLEKEEFSIAETLSCEEAIFSISPSICGNVAAIQVDWEFLKKNKFNDKSNKTRIKFVMKKAKPGDKG